MKQFPAHIAAQVITETHSGSMEADPAGDAVAETHPLAAELEHVLSARVASVGTLAAILEQLLGELNVVRDHVAPKASVAPAKGSGA